MKNIFIILAAILLFTSCRQPSTEDKMKKLVKGYLDSTLKDPKSYEPISFEIDTINDLNNPEDKTVYGFMVTHKFRAKNGFGAIDLNDLEFRIDSAVTKVQFSQPAKHRFRKN